MICKKCGEELSIDSLFCNKCGAKIEECIDCSKTINETLGEAIISVEREETASKKFLDNKRNKFIAISAIALVFVLFVLLFSGRGRDYQGSSNLPAYPDDDFGVNNDFVEEPKITEAITSPPIDIEVEYPEVLKCGGDKMVRVVNYEIAHNPNPISESYTIKVTFEKLSYTGSLDWGGCVLNVSAYDSAGNLLDTSGLSCMDFPSLEDGECFSDTYTFYREQGSGELAKIKIENNN